MNAWLIFLIDDVLQYILGLIVIVIIWLIFKAQAQKHKNWNRLFKQGAISGGITVLLAIALYQLPLLYTAPELLIIALMVAMLSGLPSGGIGGLIAGSIWKHDKASFLGGAIGGAIIILILLTIGVEFAPYFLYGGS